VFKVDLAEGDAAEAQYLGFDVAAEEFHGGSLRLRAAGFKMDGVLSKRYAV
jgi:hypothetical protein